MSRDKLPDDITKLAVVYRVAGMEEAEVERGVEYRNSPAGALTMDIYRPPGSRRGARTPAVVIVAGYPDPGFEAKVGCRFKELGSSVSWARLLAASGLAGITYANREPEADLCALLAHVRRNAPALGVDERRLGLWASSGNAPLALSVLMRDGGGLKCAALCYPYTLDAGGDGPVALASRRWGFVNPCAGKSAADLPDDVPLFIARAGRDAMPGLNQALDRFLSEALARNLPVTLTNHPAAPHAFDLIDSGETSREVVRRALAFLRFHLTAAPGLI